MAAVKQGDHTHAVDDIHWHVSQNDCRSQLQVVYYDPQNLKCRHSAVVSQIGHPVEPYLLSLVEIPLSTWSVTKGGGKLLSMHDAM
jgi:hypothetical protein